MRLRSHSFFYVYVLCGSSMLGIILVEMESYAQIYYCHKQKRT